jgi:hypothetical protein
MGQNNGESSLDTLPDEPETVSDGKLLLNKCKVLQNTRTQIEFYCVGNENYMKSVPVPLPVLKDIFHLMFFVTGNKKKTCTGTYLRYTNSQVMGRA